MQARSGALDTIGRALTSLSSDKSLLAVFIAWFFALFMEGAAGFGTPIALAAPLLVSLGFTPVVAVALPLVGHIAGVSFGAIGTPVFAQLDFAALAPDQLAGAIAILHVSLGAILTLFIVSIASSERLGIKGIVWALVAAACFLVPYLLLATLVGPELPTVGGALIGGLVFAILLRWRGEGAKSLFDVRDGLWAMSPYVALFLLVLATRLVTPLQTMLRNIELAWTFAGAFGASMELLYHPGTMVLLAFLLGGFVQHRPLAEIAQSMGRALYRLAPVAVALFAMLGISRLMIHFGMIETLAQTASLSGLAWPLLAPLVGVIGTFVTIRQPPPTFCSPNSSSRRHRRLDCHCCCWLPLKASERRWAIASPRTISSPGVRPLD